MPLPKVSVVDVDGIPAYTAQIPLSFTGTLMFGVGLRDETARTGGLAHLIEHLVMKQVGKVTIAHNATTSDDMISFFAQGSPAAVADFLIRVGEAITTLDRITEADVAEQRRIISNELGDHDERPGRGHLVDRFGNQSFGLLDLGTPAHRSHTRADVLDFAQTWLHAGNAAITATGDLPDGFSLRLPAARELPPRPETRVIRHGHWVVNGQIPAVISVILDGPDATATGLTAMLLGETLHEKLRTERHLIYAVDPMVFRLSDTARLVGYALDPRPEHAVEAARAALDVIRDLEESGPSAEALAEIAEKWAGEDESVEGHGDYLDTIARSVLRGHRRRDEVTPPTEASAVALDDVRGVLRGATATAFITLSDEVEAESAAAIEAVIGLPSAGDPDAYLASLDRRGLHRHFMADTTDIYGGRLLKGARGADIIVDDERVTLSDGDWFEVRYDDLVLASYSEKHRIWVLCARQGHILFIDLDQWRGSAKLHAQLQRRIPPEVQATVEREAA